MSAWSRASYLAATAILTAVGAAAAPAIGAGSPAAVAAGLVTAWALQAPSFWRLAGTLARGEPAVRDWVAGMALRLGGLGVVAAAGSATGLSARDTAVAYVAALLVHLALEAVWLFQRQPDPGEADARRRRDRTAGTTPGGGPAGAGRTSGAEDERDRPDETSDRPGRAAGTRSASYRRRP